MPKILVSDNLANEGVELLKQIKNAEVLVKTGMKEEELLQVIPDFDGLVVRSATQVTPKVLKAASKLKLIGRAGIGVDNINLKESTNHGVIVMNTPFGNTVTTAEHAIALLFSAARMIPQASSSTHQGKWEKKKFKGREITGKTLGLVGMGNIGKIVAERALGLKMQVKVYDPFLANEVADSMGVSLVSLEELLKNSDFVTIHVPMNDGTRNLISEKEFGQMKSSAFLIHCARGGIVNEDALCQALQNKVIAGAALDVFEKEPIAADHPFLGLDNIILTPHLGASTSEAQVNVAIDIANQFKDYFENNVISNSLNMMPLTRNEREELGYYIDLSTKLGSFAYQVASGKIASIDIGYHGEVSQLRTRFLSQVFLKNMMEQFCEDVNFVNASSFAKAKGINISQTSTDDCLNFSSSILIRIKAEEEIQIRGTIFGTSDVRIVKINDYRIDLSPKGNILLMSNKDKPGVIGKIGSFLAEKGVNIAKMQLVQNEKENTAFSAFNVDSKVSNDLLDELRSHQDILVIKQINMQDS